MRLIDADMLMQSVQGNPLITDSIKSYVRASLNAAPTIKAYTIEDLRDAYREGQDNECSYHWGIRKAEPWYMKDEVEE